MTETDAEKQTSTAGPFQNWLYRAELGENAIGDPVVKIIPTNPRGTFAGERQIAACIYEIAAELERRSEGMRWYVSPEAYDSKITIELSKDSNARGAETIVEKVLAALNIRVANAK